MFAGEVIPAYMFTNFLRQVAAFILPNTFSVHAYLQAFHSIASIIMTSFLFRTMGIPVIFGLVGGVVFMNSGLHVALCQHTAGHEALFYLVASLLLIRVFALAFPGAPRARIILLYSASAVSLVSLFRWYHEAVHYALPIIFWTVFHFWIALRNGGRQHAIRLALAIIILGIIVLMCSVPMLLTAYEMSQVNKTTVSSYEQTGRFAAEGSLTFTALALPNVTAATSKGKGLFSLGISPTLGYIYWGNLTLTMLIVLILKLLLAKRFSEFSLLGVATVLFLGFAYGAGSPIHYLITVVFPPIGMMRHNYYGFHLLYLLAGYCVARVLYELPKTDCKVILSSVAMSMLIVFGLTVYLLSHRPTGLLGSIEHFYRVLGTDATTFIAANILFGILSCTVSARRIGIQIRSGAMGLLSLLVILNLVWPSLGQHFLPTHTIVPDWKQGNGALSPSAEIRKFVATHRSNIPTFREPRVLPLGVGWWGNSLYLSHVASLNTSDTQGNRFILAMINNKTTPSPEDLFNLATRIGIDYLWIGSSTAADRRLNIDLKAWHAAAITSKHFKPVVRTEYLGTLYSFQPQVETSKGQRTLGLEWFCTNHCIIKTEGWFSTRYKVDLCDCLRRRHEHRLQVSLPIMWLSQFEIRNEAGQPIHFYPNEYGAIQIEDLGCSGSLTIEYPKHAVKLAIIVAVGTYGLIIIALASSLLLVVYRGMTGRDKL
jgi:hypothetical protein